MLQSGCWIGPLVRSSSPFVASRLPPFDLELHSAIYGCGYNSCGCHVKLSEVRSRSFGVDLGPAWGPLGPKPAPKRPPNDPDHNLNLQPHELQPHPSPTLGVWGVGSVHPDREADISDSGARARRRIYPNYVTQ